MPTSFAPHQPDKGARKPGADVFEFLGYFFYLVLGIVFVLAVGVFLYARLLDSAKEAKDEQLTKAIAQLDVSTVSGIARLHDRLAAGSKLLDAHPLFSQVLPLLENVMPNTVQFTSLHLSFDATSGHPSIDGVGVAKSYNSLALASAAFAKDTHFKGAVFKDLKPQQDLTVQFSFSAAFDPTIVAFTP